MTHWLSHGWDMNLHYALRLVTDVPEERMVYQPAPGMNHPAWVLCHLCLYHPAILGLVRNEPFQDPRQSADASRYDEGSTPVDDILQYLRKATLVEEFTQGHKAINAALEQSRPGALEAPPLLDRWRQAFGTTGSALAYLMLVHESVHLGQISTWRRVQGLPCV